AFMAASMMIPGLFAGMLQEAIGYSNFFIVVMVSCVATILVTRLVKIDPSFGIRKEAKASN
ncbi:MAG: MFS transporter, partial [Bacteroidaceae bacterium]|nr:MFS transporter [Bacteroidaceae bacterium]